MSSVSSIVQEHFVECPLVSVEGAKLLWNNNGYFDKYSISHNEFLSCYSIAIKNAAVLGDVSINPEWVGVGLAERYGGNGLGPNGGGARTINYHGMQCKGVGANMLVGAGARRSHSYGGLDLQSAIKEVVISSLLNHISPIGAIDNYAIILLNKSTGLHNEKTSWAVSLIREKTLRPAHILRAPNFSVKDKRINILSDSWRVKSIYKNLDKRLGLDKFMLFFQEFVDNSANQFSFCQIARFSHNALTESNLSFDGRLLDTSTGGFVNSGYNFSQMSDFYFEPQISLRLINEIYYLFHKYNEYKLPVDYLQDLYIKKFNTYKVINAGFVFGLPSHIKISLSQDEDFRRLANMIDTVIISGYGKEKISVLPSIEVFDRLNHMLTLGALWVRRSADINFSSLDEREFADGMKLIALKVFHQVSHLFCDLDSFLTAFLAQTLKRAYLSSVFFSRYLYSSIDEFCTTANEEDIQDFIDNHVSSMKWIFEELSSNFVTLFRSSDLTIVYFPGGDNFCVNSNGTVVLETRKSKEVKSYLLENHINLIFLHYNYLPFVISILSLLDESSGVSFRGIQYV